MLVLGASAAIGGCSSAPAAGGSNAEGGAGSAGCPPGCVNLGTGGSSEGGSGGAGGNGALTGGSSAGTYGVGGRAGAAPCLSDSTGSSGCDLHPPPYIDVTLCAQIVDDGGAMRLTDCIACCSNGSYPEASFINQGHCTCADLPTASEPVTCADQVANASICGTCCQAVGYGRWSWSSTVCTCVGRPDDATVCAATVDMVIPALACSNCCINNGFLDASYFALGKACTCTE
jgi:hypothetical protein